MNVLSSKSIRTSCYEGSPVRDSKQKKSIKNNSFAIKKDLDLKEGNDIVEDEIGKKQNENIISMEFNLPDE